MKSPEDFIEETQTYLSEYVITNNVVEDYPYHMLSMWASIGALLVRISNQLGGE